MAINDIKHSSLIKLAVFVVALYADVNYAVFLLNPEHWGNVPFFLMNATADFIMLFVFTVTWGTALYFEFFKFRYYSEIDFIRAKGKRLASLKTAIFVPVVKEDLSLVKRTVQAVKNIRGNTEIHLLDDGGRDELKKLAKSMGVLYQRRDSREFFKAGNLNHGLTKTKAKFIAVFDADYIPQPEFLEETLPMFADPGIGAVQTPQGYYNEENIFARGMKNIENLFYRYIMPGKHMLGGAFIVGTNVVYRTEALKKTGGITNIDHSEDIFTSLALAEEGYRVFYLNKQLAVGLAPTTIVSFFNQQFRWALGGFTMLFKHNPFLDKRLNVDQRIQFAFSNLFYLTGLAVTIYLFSPFIAMFFDVRPIDPAYFEPWLIAYGLFFVTNLGFFTLLIPRYRLETMMLGLISFIPYMSALIAALSQATFHWKETNFISRDVVTRRISPILFYVIAALAILNLVVTDTLVITPEKLWYLLWMGVNTVLLSIVIVDSYRYTYTRSK